MLQAKIVVIGSINMDLVTRASKFPRAGETLLGNSFHRFMGGRAQTKRLQQRVWGKRLYSRRGRR